MAGAGPDFDGFYAREIAPWVEEKEAERRVLAARALRRAVPLIVGAACIFALFSALMEDNGWRDLGYFASFAVLATGGLQFVPLMQWGRTFAGELSERIFAHFGYRYSPDVPPDFLAPFEQCRLLPGYSRKTLEDHVAGEVNGVPFELAEAFLEKRVRRDKRDDYETVFRGIVARYRFPKRFSGRTILRGDQGLLNALGHSGVPGERVRLEDPRFEKHFEVFSEDQVEARYLLTPAFMERLSDLKEKMKDPVQAAFEGEDLLIAIDGRRGYFSQPSVWKDLRGSDHIRRFVEDIALIRGIAETLKLDTKARV
ncbi:MAG: DUF3137 domain-containing protein [Parvibaculum sp.]|nr:DUF3137 domain-containing protein [Parvibaculum sp.]